MESERIKLLYLNQSNLKILTETEAKCMIIKFVIRNVTCKKIMCKIEVKENKVVNNTLVVPNVIMIYLSIRRLLTTTAQAFNKRCLDNKIFILLL